MQQLLLRACEVARHLYLHGYELVAAARTAQIRDALALETEHGARLSAFGDGELHIAVDGRNLDLRAEDGLGVADLLLKQNGGAVALEAGVRTHGDGHKQIARRTAVLAGVAHAGL